jgi:hypothetical protein
MSTFFQKGLNDVPNPMDWMNQSIRSGISSLQNNDLTDKSDDASSNNFNNSNNFQAEKSFHDESTTSSRQQLPPPLQAPYEEDTDATSGDGVGDGNDDDVTSQETESPLDQEYYIFRKAKEVLQPSCFFRFIINMYAQRKMNIFFFIHFVSTIVIWFHFAMIKFEQQAESVPVGANRYWLKRLAPPLEFGTY